ncbi:MAG: hypothetical protein QOJ89_2558, partial [bacterium]
MALDRVLPAMMPLLGAAEAAAAVGAVLALRRDGETADPALAERLQAVLDAAGIGDALDDLDEHDTAGLAALVAGNLAQAADFAAVPGRPPWSNEDPEILLAQGRFSALLAGIFERHVLPAIGDGIEARMEQDGATFLDVG